MSKKAIIYCRVSSKRQEKEGHGLDSQQSRCEKFAREKGYQVSPERVFRDSFTGGGDFSRRPEMQKVIDLIEKNAHEEFVVIFDDLKRFSRDVNFHWELRKLLQKNGVSVDCPNFQFVETEEGWLHETITAVFNDYERRTNRRQVIQKQKARLEAGYWPFFPPPGYIQKKDAVHGKLLTPNEKAETIAEALKGFASGRFPEQVDVQRFLQSKDFLNGKKVHLEYVKRLLQRIVYAGYIEYPDWEVSRRKGHHKAIISLETYEITQEKLEGRFGVRKRKDINKDFPLRGFVLCSECDKAMTASWSKGRSKRFAYYRCTNNDCCRRNKSVPKKSIETPFEDLLKEIKPKREAIELTKALFLKRWEKKTKSIGDVKGRKERELKDIQQKIESLSSRVIKTENERLIEVYEKQIEDLANKELSLKDSLASVGEVSKDFETALNEVFGVIKSPYSYWVSGDINDKRLALRLVFAEQIAYDHESGFGTAKMSLPLRIFELSESDNSQLVEMGGIEPPSK